MTKLNVEFQNCCLEINYVGTEEQIVFQKSVDNISEILECIQRAVIKSCEALINFLNLFTLNFLKRPTPI
jgi:hypothetical protein